MEYSKSSPPSLFLFFFAVLLAGLCVDCASGSSSSSSFVRTTTKKNVDNAQLFLRVVKNRNDEAWFLPSISANHLKLVESLLTLMQQRQTLQLLSDRDEVVVSARTIMDALINDTCNFLKESTGLPDLDCREEAEVKGLLSQLELLRIADSNSDATEYALFEQPGGQLDACIWRGEHRKAQRCSKSRVKAEIRRHWNESVESRCASERECYLTRELTRHLENTSIF